MFLGFVTSLGFCRGSSVDGRKSSVEDLMSRVETKKSWVEKLNVEGLKKVEDRKILISHDFSSRKLPFNQDIYTAGTFARHIYYIYI